MSNKQKLELNWIGKFDPQYDISNIEPRIFVENPEKSFGDQSTTNMLIHGDNLLALKALEQNFTGRVKCIYIDPPYNTGSAFEHYDDNLEHSIWLNLMKCRLEIFQRLLHKDGSIIVQLDDQEVHYMKVLMDEIFGRSNFITTIALKSSTPSGLKTAHKNKTIIKQKDLLLVYKNGGNLVVNPQYIKRDTWDTHFSKFFDRTNNTVKSLVDVLVEEGILSKGAKLSDIDINDKKFENFYLKNRNNIFQTQPTMPQEYKKLSLTKKDEIIKYLDTNGEENYAINGRRFSFVSNSINILEDGTEGLGNLLCDFWYDIDFQNTQNEGGTSFPSGKKPEKLIKRILSLFTNPGDIVLDSFLGSGTTAAVAHKMNRNWIGIELGDHCYTHCYPRLKSVVEGIDQSGISRIINWNGGGGFKFYELSPSLLQKDKFGNWIIDGEYNSEMISEAVCKLEGFVYNPSEKAYWKQGQSTENDYIYVTTNFLTQGHLENIYNEMDPDESLLICCKAYEKACEQKFEKIEIKKIPQSLLEKCTFGNENYNLNTVELTDEDDYNEE